MKTHAGSAASGSHTPSADSIAAAPTSTAKNPAILGLDRCPRCLSRYWTYATQCAGNVGLRIKMSSDELRRMNYTLYPIKSSSKVALAISLTGRAIAPSCKAASHVILVFICSIFLLVLLQIKDNCPLAGGQDASDSSGSANCKRGGDGDARASPGSERGFQKRGEDES